MSIANLSDVLPLTETTGNSLGKASGLWVERIWRCWACTAISSPRLSCQFEVYIINLFVDAMHNKSDGNSPEWNVDRDGTFLGNADGCLEVVEAGVRLRFTKLFRNNWNYSHVLFKGMQKLSSYSKKIKFVRFHSILKLV